MTAILRFNVADSGLFRSSRSGSQKVVRPVTVTGLIKLALQAGKANPAPPVGPALGAKVTYQQPVGWYAALLAVSKLILLLASGC